MGWTSLMKEQDLEKDEQCEVEGIFPDSEYLKGYKCAELVNVSEDYKGKKE